MHVINPQMIVLAREARSLNQGDLAGKLGMSATNLSKLERGEVRAGEQVLGRIAEHTGFPLHFFYQPGSIIPEHSCYRKRKHVAQRLIMPISAQCNILRQHIQFLAIALEVAPFDPSRIEVETAEALRQKWKVGAGPVADMCALLEENGIVVMDFDFGTDRVDSRSLFTDDGRPIVFINRRLQGDRQRFSLAFELAHLILSKNDELDQEAFHSACNEFAAAFLMPEADLRPQLAEGVQVPLLAQMKKHWKVSMIALLYRADDLGLVSPNQKRYLIQQFNQMQIRRREPIDLDVPLEKPSLVRKWIESYSSNSGLSIVEMAAVLCMEAGEFQEFYS